MKLKIQDIYKAYNWQFLRKRGYFLSDDKKERITTGIGICLGLAFGAIFGLLFDNLALGLGIGSAVGLAIGLGK